jgi:uncharacterized protein (DUF433 family)
MSPTKPPALSSAYLAGIDMARIAFTPLPDINAPVDVRELPLYSLAELSFLFKIPKPTLHAWSRSTVLNGRVIEPLIVPADKSNALYSFYNLAEAHILSLTTKVHGMKTRNVRRAMEELRKESLHDLPHPLLSQEFHTDGRHIWLKQLEKRIDLSQSYQLGLAPVLDSYLELIDRDELFKPNKVFPKGQTGKIVSITPTVSSGRPIIEGTGIPVATIWNRYKAGDSVSYLADDFEISEEQIKGALNYVEQLSAIA